MMHKFDIRFKVSPDDKSIQVWRETQMPSMPAQLPNMGEGSLIVNTDSIRILREPGATEHCRLEFFFDATHQEFKINVLFTGRIPQAINDISFGLDLISHIVCDLLDKEIEMKEKIKVAFAKVKKVKF